MPTPSFRRERVFRPLGTRRGPVAREYKPPWKLSGSCGGGMSEGKAGIRGECKRVIEPRHDGIGAKACAGCRNAVGVL